MNDPMYKLQCKLFPIQPCYRKTKSCCWDCSVMDCKERCINAPDICGQVDVKIYKMYKEKFRRIVTPKYIYKKPRIYQYDLEGNLVGTYNNLEEVSTALNKNIRTVGSGLAQANVNDGRYLDYIWKQPYRQVRTKRKESE